MKRFIRIRRDIFEEMYMDTERYIEEMYTDTERYIEENIDC